MDFNWREYWVKNTLFHKLLIGVILPCSLLAACTGGKPLVSTLVSEESGTKQPPVVVSTTGISTPQPLVPTEEPTPGSPTEPPNPTSSPSICNPLDEIADSESFVIWLNCILETGSPEELEHLIPAEGVMVAPSHQGCPDGNCWPFVLSDDLIPPLKIFQGMDVSTLCFGYSDRFDQVSVTYTGISLNFPPTTDFPLRRPEDTGGYQFIFEEDPGFPGGYRWKMLLSVFIGGIEEYRGGNFSGSLVCP